MSTNLSRILQFASCFIFLGVISIPLQAADISGSKDYPLIKRYEGSQIVFYKTEPYAALKLALSAVVFNYNDQKFDTYRHLDVEGAKITIYYAVPSGISTLEVARNYQNELKAKGFEMLFFGSGEEIERNKGDNIPAEIYGAKPENINPQHPDMAALTAVDKLKSFYIAAKLARPEGDIYASAFIIEGSYMAGGAFKIPEKSTVVRVDVCEIKPMQQRMVTVSAQEMAQQIDTNGKVALYGIYFDFNKADVKSESDATLEQIGALLAAQPRLKLLVVGHTDAVGNFETNRTLSQRRAEAVVAALIKRYKIDPKRLFPVGVSFAAPVATNTTEEGRAKNRRVELVQMLEAQ
ncbi:MAG: OmpA family protein [Chthoniobacterales bacterium]